MLLMMSESFEDTSSSVASQLESEHISISQLLRRPSPPSSAASTTSSDSSWFSPSSSQPLFTLPSPQPLSQPVSDPRYHRYIMGSDSSQLVVNIPLESFGLREPPSPQDSGSQLTGATLDSASASPLPSSPAAEPPYASFPAPSLSSSTSSSVTKVKLTTSERQARRAAKHRAIDASRRSREATALSSVLLALGLPDPSLDADSSAPAKRRHSKGSRPRSKAKLLEMAAAEIHRLRAQAAVSTELPTAHRFFFQEAPAQCVIFSPADRRCVDANVEFCWYTGFHREEVVGLCTALCPAPPQWLLEEEGEREQEPCPPLESTRSFWEIDQHGFDYPVPREQSRWNYRQLGLLFSGQQRRVQCVFRVAMADHQLMNAQCSCWLIGKRGDRGLMGQFLVVQTTAEKYRRVGAL